MQNMTLSVKQFYEKYNGKAIDFDGGYGVQCVDGFKLCCNDLGIPVKATPNNYASGYWKYRQQLGYSKYFDFITGAKNFKNGDWVIWDYGSKSHPLSHIAMYYNGKCFGQRQGTARREFRLVDTNWNDALGALRPKVWAKTAKTASTSASAGVLKHVTASKSAKSFDKKLEATYKVNAVIGLNMRDGAGTNQKVLVSLPYGTMVNCYGYYTLSSGVKWLYVQCTIKNVVYTGFVSMQYLKK